MKIHTHHPLARRRAALTATVACAWGLLLSACTSCPMCQGSGLLTGGYYGYVPYVTGPVPGAAVGNFTCMRCFGYGLVPGFRQNQPQPPLSDPQLANPPVLSPPVIEKAVVDRPVRRSARR